MTIEETINGLQDMIQSKKYIEHNFDGVVDEDVCERAIELLKEQEAVKPTWGRGKPFCGACGLQIRGGKFCSECGKPIAWEGR